MTCYFPLEAWKGDKNTSGKRAIVFREDLAQTGDHLWLPCGQCIGCRLERSMMWAVRSIHEQQTQSEQGKDSCMITLTYSQENIPHHGSLCYPHVQKFLKRLRKEIAPNKIKFLCGGEYGDKFDRPHYHLLIFGYGFPDRELFSRTSSGDLFRSEQLERLWPFGFSTLNAITTESAAYVARYCMKKVNGDQADEHYLRVDERTGELFTVEPEFMHCSNGIAKEWYRKYSGDCYPSDFLMVRKKLTNGLIRVPVPRYYEKILEKEDPEKYAELLDIRAEAPTKDPVTLSELRRRELVARVTTDRFNKRSYEEGTT